MKYADYKDEIVSEQRVIMATVKDAFGGVAFGGLDNVFFGLGIVTVFKIGNGVWDEFA